MCKVSKVGCTVLFFAICALSPYSYGAQLPSPEGCKTPLIRAIHFRDVNKARELMGAGSDLNAPDCPEGTTPLIESIADGIPEISHDLIQRGADVNRTDSKDVSPLMVAAFNCSFDLVSMLLRYGGNVNAKDSDGLTALMNAAANCSNGEITAILLRSGAKVNVIDNDGESPLMLASRQGDEFAVKELIAAGADLSVKNLDGESALTIARDLVLGRTPAHNRIYALLSQLGAL